MAWPSQETIAVDLGVSARHVRNGVSKLGKYGHLSVTHRRPDKSAVYRMIVKDRNFESSFQAVPRPGKPMTR